MPNEKLARCSDAEERHKGMVTGVAIDHVASKLFTVGLDGLLRVWDFATHSLIDSLEIESSVAKLQTSRDGGLLALVCDDLSVKIVDATSLKLIRTFASAHRAAITDVAFRLV